MTVSGEQSADFGGFVDAHTHIWIAPVTRAAPNSPVLDRFDLILQELQNFYTAGGRGVIDCQPGDCGRDALKLSDLAAQSNVKVVCCTGFHRRRYYAPDAMFWNLKSERLVEVFIREILDGVSESLPGLTPIRAGFLKVAVEKRLDATPQAHLEAAAEAAKRTGVAILAHTEKGSDAELILDFFSRHGVKPQKLVLCHMDKRPDYGLHRELVEAGVLLEYDTFYRPRYYPEQYLWPLLKNMVSNSYGNSIALATDLAEAALWNTIGQGPGLVGIPNLILPRLRQEGFSSETITGLLGGNILSRLAKKPSNHER